ncbi:1-aminocyclopropane-1-carboxylate deaminase/D-cysteine desulfhydrase, PLP-dependent ACC family [Mariprofundus aestuarium]|uniref:1-aminocyclopropane-1-carboxylate deaminase/D-cysteine desulfhydrase, PLP-dependent ACC family n=1 Tax=Mariprofundus aestuarium TaxID=1921086 RepID=A0A2K8L2Z3_MARES|nr:pyridoxal-phosphate dependent enzyme [Mariprofundus aestuarium]ATX80589.1 1-aminocyclopropane-1-carboxylate deaminase/D-cysteine desulfhydrase, PLP-dependent ACC family [Mariprofundus aestuarium]
MKPLSGIEHFVLRGREFFVKRDDLIDPLLSGNKYRKLYSLIKTPAETYDDIISYGGTQSNAMLSIAALCHQKGWDFHYTCKLLPEHLKAYPSGNLKLALELGMQLHEVAHEAYEETVRQLRLQRKTSTLFVPQGGADPIAEEGITLLAREISGWQQEQGLDELHVVTPSGTGTTACYLAYALPDAKILTTPTVGDRDYLIHQMEMLGALPPNLRILENEKKHHFARPYPEFLAIYRELKAAGIEFDLIYGTNMWHTLLQHVELIDGAILYVHSGGLIGNETMLNRYFHKGLLA